MYDEILMLVINTGIGGIVYTILDIFKPMIRNLLAGKPGQFILNWFNDKFGLSQETAYATVLKIVVFVIGYCVARFQGAEGDLFVLLGKTTEPSFWGFVFMAAIIASGDLMTDTMSQFIKVENNETTIK